MHAKATHHRRGSLGDVGRADQLRSFGFASSRIAYSHSLRPGFVLGFLHLFLLCIYFLSFLDILVGIAHTLLAHTLAYRLLASI